MVILLVNRYPYKGGEPFLHNELKCLSALGKEVCIIPLYGDGNNPVFDVPDNITVLECCTHRPSIQTKLFGILHTVFNKSVWNDIKTAFGRKHSVKACMVLLYYGFQAELKYTQIVKELKKLNTKDDKHIFYSYWMHVHACIALKLKSKYAGSKFISRCHGYDLYEFRSSVGILPWRQPILEGADYILPISHAGMKYILENYSFVDRNRVNTEYLGTFEHGLNAENMTKFRVVSCSNVIKIKRIEKIIGALSKIEDLDIEWIHYGTGVLIDEMKKLAEDTLPDNIDYKFAGYCDNELLMGEYKKNHIDLFINVSETEGLPVSIMEIMSFGVPVIATDVGGTGEIVKDGINGSLVNADINELELAELIRKYYFQSDSDKNEYRRMARETWMKSFNAAANYSNFISRYLNCDVNNEKNGSEETC